MSVALEQNLIFDFGFRDLAQTPLDKYYQGLVRYLESQQQLFTIGVADCVHGGEWNSGLTHEILQQYPLPGVSSILANERVYEYNKQHGTRRRWMEQNLMFMLGRDAPPPGITSGYEFERAPEVEAWVSQFDLGFEPHGTGEKYGWVMHADEPTKLVRLAAQATNAGFVVKYPTGLARLPNVLGADMPSAWEELYPYAILTYLGGLTIGAVNEGPPLTICSFERDVAVDDLDKHHLPPFIKGFETLTKEMSGSLGVRPGCSVLAWNKKAYAHSGGGVGELVYVEESPEIRRCVIDGARLCAYSREPTPEDITLVNPDNASETS